MIPNEITASDQVSWYDEPFKDNIGQEISPPNWTLKYALRGAVTVDKTATVVDGMWKTTLSAADTADITTEKTIYWQAYAVDGDDNKVTLGSGQIKVIPSYVDIASSSFDGRTQAQKDLDAVQSAIRAMISGGAVAEYTIGNRSVKKMALSDLYIMEKRLKYDVAQEKRSETIKKGLGDPRNLYVRFK
jgi:hypothetical protein